MMAISEQWAELLEPGLRAIFEVQRDALAEASRIPMLFNVVGSDKAQEHDLGVGGMSDWEEYEGAIEYDDFDQLYKTTYTHVEYVKGFKVERKLVDDDQYNIISKRPRQLALTAMRTREKHAASVFNNAFSSSYTGGDEVSLCNDSHPLSPEHSGDTHDNYGTYALSYDNVVTVRRLMREYPDDRGELVQINPDTLLVPPELEESAWSIYETTNKVDTADWHANFVRAKLKGVIVWDYLTDANAWFMIDSGLAKLYLNWFDRVPLEFEMDPTSDFRLEARFRGYMRYSYGWSDWRWVYGNNPS
jgi:phage major head subunit gpT-like protein